MNNLWIDIIRLLLIGGTETWYVHFSLTKLTRYTPRWSYGYIIALIIYFFLTIFDAYNDFPIYFVFTLAYLLITITVQLFYKGSSILKLGVPFVSIAINYSATLFASTAIWIISEDSSLDNFSVNLRQSIPSQILLIVIACAMICLISLGGKGKTASIVDVATVAVLPMVIIMLLINEYYRYKNVVIESKIIEIDNCVIGMLLFFISLTFFFLTTTSSSFSESKDYSNTLEQMISMQAKYYADLERHQVELRKINHDIKNHTRIMHGLLKAGEIDELGQYITTISDYVSGVASPVTNCDNMLINSLINDKLGNAKQSGVDLNLCVMVPAELEINNVDMCIVLGNLLDNAIDACSHIPYGTDKFIKVDIRIINSILVIKVENSYIVPVNLKGSEYITTKRDKRYHGLGLKNIQRIVDKYDGRLIIKHSDNVFSVTAMLTYLK